MSKFKEHLDKATQTVSFWHSLKRNALGVSRSISFAAHEHDGEFVLRMYTAKGFVSLGVLNGRDEADLICRSLNLVCGDWASSAKLIKQAWEQYAK